jgi:hypothetical protein
MKLNRGLVVAMAMAVGSLAIVGCSKSSDESAEPVDTATEQASVNTVEGENQAVASNDEGTTQYARFGRSVRGHAGEAGRFGHAGEGRFGRGERGDRFERGGFERGGRGFGRGERWGERWGEPRRERRAWWRFW